MYYDLYFHNDFDGRASAAVFLDFFAWRKQQEKVATYIPVNYPLSLHWHSLDFFKKENELGGKGNPAIIVDFRYHPSAVFWMDHHPTTFDDAVWEKQFKKTSTHDWDSSYPSCCHQVVDVLQRNFGYQPSKNIKELAKWLDIVDGANYETPKQAVFQEEPALRISTYIHENKRKEASLKWLIEALSKRSIPSIARDTRIVNAHKERKKKIKKTLNFYKKELKEIGPSTYIDISEQPKDLVDLRFAPYLLYPDALYAVILKKRKTDGKYHISAGVNPWARSVLKKIKNPPHFGDIMKSFGGGGHAYVGGVELETYTQAKEVAQKIIEILKNVI